MALKNSGFLNSSIRKINIKDKLCRSVHSSNKVLPEMAPSIPTSTQASVTGLKNTPFSGQTHDRIIYEGITSAELKGKNERIVFSF